MNYNIYDDEIELLKQALNSVQNNIHIVEALLKPKDDNPENEPYLIAIKSFISKLKPGFAKTNLLHSEYINVMNENSTKIINTINCESESMLEDIQHLQDELYTLQKKNKAITHELDTFLVTKNENSELCKNDDINYSSPLDNQSIHKNSENDTLILTNDNYNLSNDPKEYELILKYINDDDTLLDDLKNMDSDKKKQFMHYLELLQLPIKMNYINQLYINNDKFLIKSWNDKMILFMNDQQVIDMNTYLIENDLINKALNINPIKCDHNMNANLIICMNIKLKYAAIIEDYLNNDVMNPDLLTIIDLNYDDIITEMNRLGIYVNESKILEAWKKNRYIYINNEYNESIDKWIKNLRLFKTIYDDNNNKQMGGVNTKNKSLFIYINIELKYPKFIKHYFQTNEIDFKLLKEEKYNNDLEELENELKKVGKEFDVIDRKILRHEVIVPSIVLTETKIVENIYDAFIYGLLGTNIKWKLIYRASDHDFTAQSFHDCCDNIGPTLIIFQSSNYCIFGAYTKEKWSSEFGHKKDSKAFVFTLKNSFDVPPTKYNVLPTSEFAISCEQNTGPIFYGNGYEGCNIYIGDKCNVKDSCYCNDKGEPDGYEDDPQYHKSLFVNKAGPEEKNWFSVCDYEVYTIDR